MIELRKILNKTDKAQKSGIINMFLKPISMFLSLVYTPMLLHYLGDEKYGLWVTVLSIINWVNYFDVGIGNGMRHLLAKELADDEKEKAAKTVSTSYIVLTLISMVLLLCLIILTGLANWGKIFSTSVEMRPTLIISFVFICVNFVLSLNTTILYALQLSERVALNNCMVQCINVAGLLLISQCSRENLVYIAILFGASTMIVHTINSIRVFRKFNFLLPRKTNFRKSEIRGITGIGIKFFVIQIMCLMMFTVDNLLISHFWGASEVTPFSITNKVFNTAYTVLAAFLVPFWSRSTVAFEKKDINWIRKSLRSASIMCGLFVIGYVMLSFLFKPLVTVWMRKELNIPDGLIVVMAIYYSLYSALGVECQFINGSGRINLQLVLYVVAGFMNIPLSILIGVQFGLGPTGVQLATGILVFMMVILLGFNLRKIINDTEKNGGNKNVCI